MKINTILTIFNSERGVSAILIAILMVVFIGFAALALDLSHLFVAQNELKNAADAGALAGAQNLYNAYGTAINEGANQIGHDAAEANESEKIAVEVNWTSGNTGDVQRGHWSFASEEFTPSASTVVIDLWGVSDDELDGMDGKDGNPPFINAVRVITRREETPVASFFARIFKFESFQRVATAVAYIGFAGTLAPGEVDQPIAICEESILNELREYDCNIGRMINSGQNIETNETGGWTSFNQEKNTGDDPCSGGTNAQEVNSLICREGNPGTIYKGDDIATSGGEIQSAFNSLIDCWNEHIATEGWTPWTLVLPVISCPSNNITTCQKVMGAVMLNVVWITGAGEDPSYNNAPTQMFNPKTSTDWISDSPDGQVRWNSFAEEFALKNVDGSPAPYAKKSIYFLPDCTKHELAGKTGGNNYGILARIPVLVK